MSGRRSHIGMFYIAVDAERHGKGIGTALITKILDLADNWLILERVELGVLVTNPRTQALYERFGFVVEGKKVEVLKSAGQYVDEILMSRLLQTACCSKFDQTLRIHSCFKTTFLLAFARIGEINVERPPNLVVSRVFAPGCLGLD